MFRNPETLPSLGDLAQHDAQVVANDCDIPVIWCDHQATRRQRLHGANVPGGDSMYSTTHLTEAFNHISLEGYNCAILVCEDPAGKHHACYAEFHMIEKHGTG